MKRTEKAQKFYLFLIISIVFILSLYACQEKEGSNSEEETKNLDEVIEENLVRIDEEVWDVLWISDSSGWGVADIYGQFIAEDNGVEVNVKDYWTGGLSVVTILQAIKEKNTYNMQLDSFEESIAEAEVIVVYGHPAESVDPTNPGDWNCGQEDLQACYVNACGMETFETYIKDFQEIFSIIFELRAGKPTIIRTYDAYNPRLVSTCGPDGAFEICKECWENFNQAIHQAADEMGVPVVNVFDAWNGLDHTENPVDKGYTQEDNVHPSVAGATVIAELLRALGYDPIIP